MRNTQIQEQIQEIGKPLNFAHPVTFEHTKSKAQLSIASPPGTGSTLKYCTIET